MQQELPEQASPQRATVSRVEPAGLADVYNIAVEETHTFSVEGGIVVHNSYDAGWHVLPVFERGFVKPRGRVATKVVANSVRRQQPTEIRGRQVVARRR